MTGARLDAEQRLRVALATEPDRLLKRIQELETRIQRAGEACKAFRLAVAQQGLDVATGLALTKPFLRIERTLTGPQALPDGSVTNG